MNLDTVIEFRRARKFGDVISDTSAFVRQNFKKLSLSIIRIAGPVILLTAIAGAVYTSNIFSMMGRLTGQEGDVEGAIGILISGLIFIPFSALSVTMVAGVVYEYIMLYIKHGPDGFDVPDVWPALKEDLFMLILTTIGQFIIIMIAYVLFIIPGVYVTIPLTMIQVVRVHERTSFSEAFSRCFELARDNWWRTLGVLVVLYLIISFATSILSIPQYALLFVNMLHSIDQTAGAVGDPPSQVLAIIASFIPLAGTYLFYGLLAVGVAIQYFSLVEQKDGTGLRGRIEEFGTTDRDESTVL